MTQPKRKFQRRKLLTAALGVATVSYVAGCIPDRDREPPNAIDILPTGPGGGILSGNLMAPPGDTRTILIVPDNEQPAPIHSDAGVPVSEAVDAAVPNGQSNEAGDASPADAGEPQADAADSGN